MTKRIFIILLVLFFSAAQSQQFPILGFMGPPANKATKENYNKMREAGFNISLMTFPDLETSVNALSAAENTGVKLILFFPQLHTHSNLTIPKVKVSKSLLGYFIGDEPSPKDFNDFINYADIIRTYDKEHLFYINLHPIYAPEKYLAGLSYKDYVSKSVKELPLKFISFDHYALVNDKIRNNFYENLEIIRSASLKSKMPFWGFACSTIHFDYLKPKLSGIKLQQFGNLLYGAQGVQYFTYWTMTSDPAWKRDNYSYAIVDDNGNPTPTYNIVKAVNQQIQRLSWVFLGAQSDNVFHTGNEIPEGTKKLMSLPKGFKYFSTNGKNALVSLMSNKKDRFVIIQNKSLDTDLILNYQLLKGMKVVENSSGKIKNISSSKRLKTSILPGDILIFTFKDL